MNKKYKFLIPTILLSNIENPVAEKIIKPWDKIQKQYSKDFINWIFKYYGIDEEIINEKNTEINDLTGKTYNLDYVGDNKKNMTVNVEFQTNSITPADKKRFEEYAHALRLKYGKDVVTYVFSLEQYEEKIIKINWGPGNTFTIHVINYTEIPTNEILNNVENKILNQQKLNEDDLLFLKVGFITADNIRTFDLLAKMIKLTNKIKTETKKDIGEMLSAYLTFAKHLLKEKEYNKIIGLVKMERNIFIDILGDEILKTYEQGEIAGIKEVAKNLLKRNMPEKDIKESTNLTQKQINQLKQELNTQ